MKSDENHDFIRFHQVSIFKEISKSSLQITTYSLFAQICHAGHEGHLCKEESGKTFGKGLNQKNLWEREPSR